MKTSFLAIFAQLEHDFPEFFFVCAAESHWSQREKTIYARENVAELFHELGHAELGHATFVQDVELLKMERDAWTAGVAIAQNYGVKIADDAIESALDEYRDWLHARSLCPACAQTGIQHRETLIYECLNCGTRWTPNDARKNGLKRRRAPAKR